VKADGERIPPPAGSIELAGRKVWRLNDADLLPTRAAYMLYVTLIPFQTFLIMKLS
jgi:hypothetical protein